MADNTLNKSSLIAPRMVQMLHAKGMLPNTLDQSRTETMTQRKYAPGTTISVDIEHQPSVTQGAVSNVQDVVNRTVDVTVNQYNNAEKWTSIEARYDMNSDQGVRDYADSLAKRLIREVDKTGFDYMAKHASNSVGTPGVDAGAIKTWGEGAAKIDDQLGDTEIFGAVNPMGHVALTDALKGANNPKLSNPIMNRQMKECAGINFYKCNSISRFTKGTATNSTPVMNGATADGAATISINGLSAATATITEKTHFTIDACYAVDPETKVALPYLKDFSVTATGTGSGSAIAALAISPTIYGPDSPHQNVDALPLTGAALTLTIDDNGACNILYTRDAFTLIALPLPHAQGDVHTSANRGGIVIRTGFGSWNTTNDTQVFRCDAAWGFGAIRPDHATKVGGA